ncbi:MAG: hypothetical protein ABI461_16140 [Polyangiaceae bacterium]
MRNPKGTTVKFRAMMFAIMMASAACGGSGNGGTSGGTSSGGSSSLAGSWDGKWQSANGMGGAATLSLAQNGTQLSGTTTLSDSVCFVGAKVTGTVEGDDVHLDITAGDAHATAHLTVISDTEVDGTYDAVSAGVCTGDTGTLTATR